MANLKEVRARISSVISTQQITKAMKLVSATKLRRAQTAIVQMRPYAAKLQSIMANLSGAGTDIVAPYFTVRETGKVLVIVITSDRGLCGAFNANVFKKASQLINTKYATQKAAGKVTVIPIGKKGFEAFQKTSVRVNPDYRETFLTLNAELAFNIAHHIIQLYLTREYDVVEIVYNQFKNASTQILVSEQFLPISTEATKESKDKKPVAAINYIFEPSQEEILSELIPRTLKTQFYRALLESVAGEHGARMIAMDKATENAGELLKALKLQYNQARQAAITNEISEIVGGAAALQG
jgi:F-type H+-transporting ATPase subunit gamma